MKIPFGLCQCGCGNKTSIATQNHSSRGYIKGQPIAYCFNHRQVVTHRDFEAQVNVTKVCRVCHAEKPGTEFSYNSKGSLTLRSYCKACCVVIHRRLPLTGSLVRRAKVHAKKKDVPFSLTRKDIIVPSVCPILGITMERPEGRFSRASYSIDEIVPGVGYIPSNVQVVSYRANAMKQDASPKELLAFADWIYRTFKP